jgi:serine/threonine-protein kinase
MERSVTMSIDVGRVIGGKYELERLLGRGSMGEVWSAHHVSLGEKLALKLLTQAPSSGDDPDGTAAARFQFEAQVAARLSSKTRHIVRVTDHGEEEGLAYLVMEQLEGETLETVLERDGRVPLATVTKIVTQVARALSRAHEEGVLHRDLKPANVFLTQDEEGKLLVKLLDFGIARAIHAHRAPSAFSTAKGLVFGTPCYMSPEQARGSRKLDHRCDLWALATTAYECFSGALPVSGDDVDQVLENLCAYRIVPLRQRRHDTSDALEAFFQRAFDPSPDQRFQSAEELAQAFARAAASGNDRHAATDPPSAMPASVAPVETETQPPPRLEASRGLGARALLVGGVALVLLLGSVIAWRNLGPAAVASSTSAPATSLASAPPSSPLPAPPALPVRPASTTVTTQPSTPPVPPVPLVSLSSLPPARSLRTPAQALSTAPVSAAPPAPPAPAKAPAPKVDKSEVF